MHLIASLHEYKNPIVVTCFGIISGSIFYFKNITPSYVVLCCLILCFLFIGLKKTKIILLMLSILFGYFYTHLSLTIFTVDLDKFLNQQNIFTGEMISAPDNSNLFYKKYFLNIYKIINKTNCKHIQLKTRVLVHGTKYEEYFPGDIVQISGTLKKPKSSVLPGLFNERKYLLTKGVKYLLKAEPGSLVFLDSPKETLLARKIYKIRGILTSALSRYLPHENLALINGIILGSKAVNLPGDLKDKIQNLGLSHLTSASGFNVSVICLGIFFILRLFTRNNLIPSIISFFAIIFYTALADFSNSVIRSAIFISFVLLGNLFNKKPKILPGISLILIIFFLVSPVNLLDLSLQLSILAFLGLVLFGSSFEKEGYPYLLKVLIQTFFAQIMIVPLIVFYFHNIQLLGLVSNIIAIPLASILLICGLISLLSISIFNFESLNMLLTYTLKVLSNLFLAWVNLLDKIPLKQIFLPSINFYLLILIYIIIILVLCMILIPSVKKWLALFLIIFLLITLLTYKMTDTSKYLKILCFPKYNQEALLLVPPKEKPIFFGTMLDENTQREIKDYLTLNNIPKDFTYIDLNKDSNTLLKSLKSNYLQNKKNEINIVFKNFKFKIVKNYPIELTNDFNCVRLPLLRKSDPLFNTTFHSYPQYLIVNDYKRLSKKSIQNIQWLKSKSFNTFFLSESGTITLVTSGKDFKVHLENENE